MEEYYHTLFLAVKLFLWHDQLEISIPGDLLPHHQGVGHFSQESLINPLDGLKISAGYSALYGPENSLLDMVGPTLNAGYLSIKLSF